MCKRKILFTALAASTLFTSVAEASPFSANLGWNSEYIFRGIPQSSSSAFGGVDFEAKGFYAGTWGADVGDGLEIDYYAGYGYSSGEFSISAGGTLYRYTDDFDDDYQEFNFSAGYSFLTLDVAIGTYDNFGGPELDYQFYSLKGEYEGFHALVGTFEEDFDGSYYEIGYGNTLTFEEHDLFDYSFVVIYSDSTLLGGDSEYNMVFSLSKTFDF
jgi:uncharacterized protein (TIGR02001 family)